MSMVKNHVRLSAPDRKKLQDLISKGSATAKSKMHANILLETDENNPKGRMSETEAAEIFNVSKQTVHNIRQRYSEAGLDAAISRKKRGTPPIPAKITGDVEARIIALSCSAPPSGRSKWTLRLLADKAVELEIIESISYVAVGELLKKRTQNPLEKMLGHSPTAQRSLCCMYGRCFGCLSATIRSSMSGYLYG